MECFAVTPDDFEALLDAVFFAVAMASVFMFFLVPLTYRWTCDFLEFLRERRERREWL